ncbi:MAG TPA: exopolysaccharide biosynthesis polyprenyl glycosylphosphotransferase, partial [Phycisphaeraceae bacterium]
WLGSLTRESLNWWLGNALKKGQYEALALGMLVLPIVYAFVGLYPGYGLSMVERLRRRVYTVSVLFALLILWDYLVMRDNPSRGVLLLTFAFAVVLGPLMEAGVRRLLMLCRCWGTPVVVLGAGPVAALLIRILHKEPELGLVPVAVFDDNPARWGTKIEGAPVLGPLSRAKTLGKRVSIALLAMPELAGPRQAHLCARLPFPKVILIPDLMGLASLWVSSRDLGGIVGLEVKKNLSERRNWYLKRTLDYLLGVPLFILSLPLMAFFALWIKLVSRDGPVFYRQLRVGLGGRSFHVWKLRTMYSDADRRLKAHLAKNPQAVQQWERYCKLKDDPRILPGVGRLLRRTSLDELPQLWNVLRGQMSLVGPRPFPHYHLDRFSPEFRALRRRVLPGLTGLWQVSARSDGDVGVQEVLDTYYIRNWSPWLDLYLLARTVGAVLMARGAY